MDISALKEFLNTFNYPQYRYRQIITNYYSGRHLSFETMTDLPKDLRVILNENFNLLSLKPNKISNSSNNKKAALILQDKQIVESVVMDYDNWLTACLSSQVGCALNCQFCATGKIGFIRNLTAEEIIDQIIFWNNSIYPKYIGRIVFMGMGEPFLNWENLLSALKIINSPDGLNIGSRKISISTAGITPKIIAFANLKTEINLAVSLHSLNQNIRNSIMPISSQFPISGLIDACNYYTTVTHRQLFFEYSLIKDLNDKPKDLASLINLLQSNHLFYLNIIPLNKILNGLFPSSNKVFNSFTEVLANNHLNFSIRRTLGSDISAACGQLATLSRQNI